MALHCAVLHKEPDCEAERTHNESVQETQQATSAVPMSQRQSVGLADKPVRHGEVVSLKASHDSVQDDVQEMRSGTHPDLPADTKDSTKHEDGGQDLGDSDEDES